MEKAMKLVKSPLDIPLYMVSRNPFKSPSNHQKLQNYIIKRKPFYIKNVCQEDCPELKQFQLRKYHYLLNDSNSGKFSKSCIDHHKENRNKSSVKEKSWQLAPNRYGLENRPFARLAGLKGAYWRKSIKTKSRTRIDRSIGFRFYELPKEMEKMKGPCHLHKGTFPSNPRERRATTRGMICNPLTAYKDPTEPAPNTYTPKAVGRTYEIIKPQRPLHPHVYYPKSVVPVKPNSIHPPHISFLPGPGRYETRYCRLCPCPGKKQYQPELDLLVDREKRMKFRGKPYMKIKKNQYCSPDWQHVRGKGFRRLFQGSVRSQMTMRSINPKAIKGKSNLVKLFHDAKYLNMILNNAYDPGTYRRESMPELPKKITFNCIIKIISRKQLRVNKKLAFGSSAERWKDEERSAVLTSQQMKEILAKLPEDRKVRNQPIMCKKPEEIVNKLMETPKHMLPNYVPKLRKRLFKFLPLPEAKILTTNKDIQASQPATHGYFLRPLDEKLFFKDK